MDRKALHAACVVALIQESRECIYCARRVADSRGLDWCVYSYRFGIDVVTVAHHKCHKEACAY
jgi:hypothetical protein